MMPESVKIKIPVKDVLPGLGAQFRAARALLGKTTREVADIVGCSAMAVSKVETGSVKRGDVWIALTTYYQDCGLCFYCGGVVRADDAKIQCYAEPLRERLLDGGSGSVYLDAFDHIIALASRGAISRS